MKYVLPITLLIIAWFSIPSAVNNFGPVGGGNMLAFICLIVGFLIGRV
jgi:hypothetical protein